MPKKLKRRVKEGKVNRMLGQFIKERREELGMSRSQLANKVGYKWPNFITMLELSTAQFPVCRWKDYAEALQVPPHEFLQLVFEEIYPDMMPFFTFRAPEEPMVV